MHMLETKRESWELLVAFHERPVEDKAKAPKGKGRENWLLCRPMG